MLLTYRAVVPPKGEEISVRLHDVIIIIMIIIIKVKHTHYRPCRPRGI
jgi:hypothetical protein